jgi:hypothetical protein
MGSDPEKEHSPTTRAAHQFEPLSTSTVHKSTTPQAKHNSTFTRVQRPDEPRATLSIFGPITDA